MKSHISKTCHSRAARVSQGTLQAIQESIQLGQKWLFPGQSSGYLSTKTVLWTIDRLAEEAGIQDGLAPAKALPEEGHAPYPQAQSCGEYAHGRRAGAHDSDSRVGHKRL
ncbi:MAG: hypothetical protein WAW52_13965 [Methanothrix sp.]